MNTLLNIFKHFTINDDEEPETCITLKNKLKYKIEVEEEETCIICYDTMKDKVSLPCHNTHILCSQCFSKVNKCPFCRKKINKESDEESDEEYDEQSDESTDEITNFRDIYFQSELTYEICELLEENIELTFEEIYLYFPNILQTIINNGIRVLFVDEVIYRHKVNGEYVYKLI